MEGSDFIFLCENGYVPVKEAKPAEELRIEEVKSDEVPESGSQPSGNTEKKDDNK